MVERSLNAAGMNHLYSGDFTQTFEKVVNQQNVPQIVCTDKYTNVIVFGNRSKEVARISSEGVFTVKIDFNDEDVKHFVECVNAMLNGQTKLTKMEAKEK